MSETKERIVSAATELFHRHGFQATSLAAIQQHADVRGGSLYYFFRTKEELLQAALERYSKVLDEVIMDPAFAAGADDPIQRVFEVLGQYRSMLLATDFALGCPIGNLAVEMVDCGPEIRDGLIGDFDLWCRRIETCLDAAVDRLPPGVDRARLAAFVLVVMEGAVLVARGRHDINVFDDAVAQLRDYFDRLTAVLPSHELDAGRTSDRRTNRSSKA